MKRIVSIQDISCVGKCSLTVALPIISAMGVECGILPTAVLSTHTAFSEFTFCDLTDQIEPISAHWKREGLKFDAIYTGYLGSFEQLDLVSAFFDDHGADDDTLIFVDPAMGDYGKLYTGFTPAFAKAMGATVCAKADIIVPNLTEASFMLGIPYVDAGYDEAYIKDILKRLVGLGAKRRFYRRELRREQARLMGLTPSTDRYSLLRRVRGREFHGTADVFSLCCRRRPHEWEIARDRSPSPPISPSRASVRLSAHSA